MSWKRKRDGLVRDVQRALKWCAKRRAQNGGASRLREAERLFRDALNSADGAEAMDKLLSAMGILAEYLDRLR